MMRLVRTVARPIRRWILAGSCALTGHQHTLFVFLWSIAKKRKREAQFNTEGHHRFQLMSPADWKAFATVVNAQMESAGALNETRVDWAEDKRVYVDCGSEPVAAHVQRLTASRAFVDAMDRVFGGGRWEVVNTQLWRNYPERFGRTNKEINSTYYHVDNGGHMSDRLLVNVFMYLTEVRPENGPFIYYTPGQTKRINRHFIGEVFRLGNLRSFPLVERIENYIAPQQLSLGAGEAVVIDNQLCLHRAGFCAQGHRDMLQLLVRG